MHALRTLAFLLLASVAWTKPIVVSTTTILDDFVRTLGSDAIDARCLVDRGRDPHSYDPTPADLRLLARADMIVVNGLGFEGWLAKLIENSDFRGTLVVATDGVTPLRYHDSHAHGDHDHDHEHHHHGEEDPHAWHDLRLAARYVTNIREALEKLIPAEATAIAARAAAYEIELTALDTLVRTRLATIPAERRKLVTSHESLRYFGEAYGLKIIAISGLAPEQEPSARQLARIVRLIRQEKVPAIFIETTSNPKIPALIAREAGVSVHELHTDSLGAPGSPNATFLGMIRSNLDTIEAALK